MSDSPQVISGLLDELEHSVTDWRAKHRELREIFVDAAEPLARLLVTADGGSRRMDGHQGFAVNQLLARALGDLVVAAHLLFHGYLNQMYNEMRTAYEALDLIDLVGTDAAQASAWVESETPWREFSPAKVREALGKARVNDFYSHFSEQAHPRFGGANLTGYMGRRSDSGDDYSAFLSLGPTPHLDERPHFAHAAGFLFQVVGQLTLRAQYLVGDEGLSWDAFEQAAKASALAGQKGFTLAMEIAAASGQPEALEGLGDPEADLREVFRRLDDERLTGEAD